jgi:hypothetical protein
LSRQSVVDLLRSERFVPDERHGWCYEETTGPNPGWRVEILFVPGGGATIEIGRFQDLWQPFRTLPDRHQLTKKILDEAKAAAAKR